MKMLCLRGAGMPLLTLFLALLPAGTAVADWSGRVDIVEGTPHVDNPEEPATGTVTVELREIWRVGGDDEDFLFGTIAELLRDEAGNVYVLDSQLCEISVFDPAGVHLRTIGRQGEGPGEFQNAADMYWAPGGEIGVVQAWPGKVVMLTTDGLPGRAFPLPYRGGGGFQSVSRGMGVGDRAVLSGTAWTNEDGQQIQLTYLKAYDADGTELAHFHETAAEQRFGGWEFQEERWSDFQRRWAVAPDGRVAAALSFGDYRIHVWNADGSLERVIERPGYADVQRTGEEKQVFQTLYDRFTSWNPNSTFVVSDRHVAVQKILFRADGSLWVQSGRDAWRAAKDEFTAFDVYDREGRYLRRVELRAELDAVQDGIFFAGDRVYVVTDLFGALMARIGGDEEGGVASGTEPVAVIAYRLDVPELAAITR